MPTNNMDTPYSDLMKLMDDQRSKIQESLELMYHMADDPHTDLNVNEGDFFVNYTMYSELSALLNKGIPSHLTDFFEATKQNLSQQFKKQREQDLSKNVSSRRKHDSGKDKTLSM